MVDIAKAIKASKDIKYISSALELYKNDNGTYPESLALLKPKYFNKLPESVWSIPYTYKLMEDGGFVLYSLGSDNKHGGKGAAADFNGSETVEEIVESIKKPYWGCRKK